MKTQARSTRLLTHPKVVETNSSMTRILGYLSWAFLPLGAVFPFDFGYIPSTKAGDGDPLDILILLDEPAFVGCLVPAKLIGVIEASQTENQETTLNDRLVAVSAASRNHTHVRFLGDLNSNLIHEIERFFISYNETKGKRFEIHGRFGPDRAHALLVAAVRNFKRSRPTAKKSKKPSH
jgi:inorganic pyrophosphatase